MSESFRLRTKTSEEEYFSFLELAHNEKRDAVQRAEDEYEEMRHKKDTAYRQLEKDMESKREKYERKIDELELIIKSKFALILIVSSYRTCNNH
jgi:hypothetical protein